MTYEVSDFRVFGMMLEAVKSLEHDKKESRIITYPAIPNTKDRADKELKQQAFELPEAHH